jgi:hypothetical protein
MPIILTNSGLQIWDDNPSYKATATSITQGYNIIGAAGMSWDQVRAALLNYVPVTNAPAGTSYAWPRRAVTLDEVEATTGTYKATVTWSSLIYQRSMEIGGSQQQVRADKELIAVYTGSGPVPTAATPGAKGVPVGFDGKTVHGASIFIPTQTWTETVQIPAGQYSIDYENAVALLEDTPVNDARFRGCPAGDCIFHGMQAIVDTGNPDFVNATYKFCYSAGNRSNDPDSLPPLTIGAVSGIVKDGWDYLDVRWEQAVDNGTMSPKVQYVLIHRMYDRGGFSVLNIGTGENMPLWGAS